MKFILSNRRCVLLLGAWWIHVEHAKQTERMNLTIKNHGIWKINKVNTPILNWPSLTMLFFFFVLKTRLERGKVYPAIYNRIPAGAPAGADSVWKHWLGLRFELLFTRQVTSIAIYVKGVFVRSGIRTHAYKSRLRPERSALDRSAILTSVISLSYFLILQGGRGGRRGGGWVDKPSKAYWVGTRFMIHSSWNEVNLLNQLTTRTPHHLLNCLRDGSIFDQWHPR